MASNELGRATLEAELLGFQRIYLETVGHLITELDELEAKIAETKARRDPAHQGSTEHAAKARKRATESAQAFSEETRASLPASQFAPSEDLRKLFRAVARRVHPDLARNDEDRAIREELMKRANAAYQAGDAEGLRSILEEYEARPQSVEGEGIGAELIKVIRMIDLIRHRLTEIKIEIDQLTRSELAILRKRTEDAKLENKDFLAEMAAFLRRKISHARIELKQVQSTTAT